MEKQKALFELMDILIEYFPLNEILEIHEHLFKKVRKIMDKEVASSVVRKAFGNYD